MIIILIIIVIVILFFGHGYGIRLVSVGVCQRSFPDRFWDQSKVSLIAVLTSSWRFVVLYSSGSEKQVLEAVAS